MTKLEKVVAVLALLLFCFLNSSMVVARTNFECWGFDVGSPATIWEADRPAFWITTAVASLAEAAGLIVIGIFAHFAAFEYAEQYNKGS